MRPSACLVLVFVAGLALPTPMLSADGGAQHQALQSPPIKLGCSGGQVSDASSIYCCAGTLGAAVLRDGVLCVLSNNHVVARSGSTPTGDDTMQPGLIDTGCRTTNVNIIGDYAGNLVPLGSANVDTALTVARPGMVDSSGYILDIGVPCSTPQAPAINMPVRKSGRTTGHTTGTITSLNTSVNIQYQRGCNSGKRFTVSYTNQVVTTAMSAGGDSGSVLFSNDGTPNPVGLLFAGSSSVTIYNPIQSVISAYTAGGHTFSFVGTSCGGLVPDPVFPAPAEEALENAVRIKVENEADILKQPGVWGVGVGSDEVDPTKPTIVVYMEVPKDPQPGQPQPPRAKIDKAYDGVDVRIIYTDPIVAL